MADWIANIPWWLLIGLLVVGAGVVIFANRTSRSGLRSIGIAVVALALLLGVGRFLIETDAEKAERITRQIVTSVNAADWAALQTLLSAGTDTDFLGNHPNVRGAAEITQAAQTTAKAVGLNSVRIWSLRTDQNKDWITVTFVAYTVQTQTQGQPLPSSWEFDWHVLPAHQLNLTKIALLNLGGQ